jgi:CheY-like chemotaxis protein
LQYARQLHPDLVILDIHMPGADGFGVLEELRKDHTLASTPVMALTASAMQGDRQRALSAGFNSYISKPIPLSVLRKEVELLLGRNKT